ncbi:hypothetical protein NDR87_06750 [Nocardia sp. CDC159]|uniref:Cyclohexanone monooxygenase n=1 Tax=Nocardia pulmonis TaxID=2951408 RepID=A0A9X2IVM6_9NOCA|nr:MULTISPECIES: hypothetical protein [Nocardia]MCM6772644.1 hypothetical protein [Nocardia pulmonis]MCM6786053.1 hypothetical protein [Nocardia sp. CDC159]
MAIRGRDGRLLADEWTHGPRTLLGLAVHGFPNFFTMTGPGSTTVLSNVLRAIEHHAEWLVDLLDHARARDLVTIEATAAAQQDWTEQVRAAAARTLYRFADSYYVGANIPGKARGLIPYSGGLDRYRAICADIASDKYRGFDLARVR